MSSENAGIHTGLLTAGYSQGVRMNPIFSWLVILLYSRERGPLGGAPYIGPRVGGGPIFEVSVSHLDTKECPGKLHTPSS